MDEMVHKIEFDGPSLTITSKYLAVGVSALNTSNFNGTTFSAFIATNTTDPQVNAKAHLCFRCYMSFDATFYKSLYKYVSVFLLDVVYIWLCVCI